MANRAFQLTQMTFGGAQDERTWVGLDFRSFIDEGEGQSLFHNPILASACGETLDYGKLFAYCFRRFGYPQRSWDDYKELVTYNLTTPHPDLALRIVPNVSDEATLTIHFWVLREQLKAVDDYAKAPSKAWRERSLDWAERQGLPEWMDEWMSIYNTEFRAAFSHIPVATSWRDVVNFSYALGEPGSRPYQLTRRVVEYMETVRAGYAQVEPPPAYRYRTGEWTTWSDDDPLKPLVAAALVALDDLRTPVGVRDQAINAYGLVEEPRKSVKPAKSAGYAAGALGNQAVEEFSRLHDIVVKLGKGDVKKGLRKVLAAVGDL